MEKPKSNVIFEHRMSVMKSIETNNFDLGYFDFEYGIGESSKNHKSRNTPIMQKNGGKLQAPNKEYGNATWDNNTPDFQTFSEAFRITKNQFIWGANYFYEIVGNPFKAPRRKDYHKFIEENPIGWIIWDKVNGTNDFSDCELAWTSFDRPTTIVHYMWNGMMQGESIQYGTTQKGNKKLNEKRYHPTQKPMAINKWVFKNYLSSNSESVFDAGVGSQGSRISAYEYGCDFLGCENNPEIYKIGEKRFSNYLLQLQPKLF